MVKLPNIREIMYPWIPLISQSVFTKITTLDKWINDYLVGFVYTATITMNTLARIPFQRPQRIPKGRYLSIGFLPKY